MIKQDIYYLFVCITVFKIDFFDIISRIFSFFAKFLTIFDLPNKGKSWKKIFDLFFVDTLQIRINIARHLELEKK